MVQALCPEATYWCSGLECNHTCCLLLLRQWQGDNGEDLTQTVSQLCGTLVKLPNLSERASYSSSDINGDSPTSWGFGSL